MGTTVPTVFRTGHRERKVSLSLSPFLPLALPCSLSLSPSHGEEPRDKVTLTDSYMHIHFHINSHSHTHSLLSHSAVVARELGLPTIVGVSDGLMKRLKTGMRVHVDTGKGKITIVREGEGDKRTKVKLIHQYYK